MNSKILWWCLTLLFIALGLLSLVPAVILTGFAGIEGRVFPVLLNGVLSFSFPFLCFYVPYRARKTGHLMYFLAPVVYVILIDILFLLLTGSAYFLNFYRLL